VNSDPPTPGPAPEPGPDPTAAPTPAATPRAADPRTRSIASTIRSSMKRVKGPVRWLVGVVLTAVVGLLVAGGGGWLERVLSEISPLRPVVISVSSSGDAKASGAAPTEYGDEGFKLLVTDPDKLPANIKEIDDCKTLWSVGRAAGGTLVGDQQPSGMFIDVQAGSKEGLRIVALRAKITKHAPTPDGVLLVCPPPPRVGGPQEPLHISFDFRAVDLNRTDSVRAEREGSPEEGEDARQFEEGYSIVLDKNESIELAVSTNPSIDDLDWHIEADAVVGRTVKTIRIDQGGKEFHTPGYRWFDDYQEGHSGEEPGWNNGPALDWGVDKDTVLAPDQRGGQVLRWNGVTIPYIKGLDVYIPYSSDNQYREIRYNRRTLISFNPPGVEARDIEVSEGVTCAVGARWGKVESVGPVVSEVRKHGNSDFTHRTIDYVCGGPNGLQERYRRESIQRVGSPIVFRSELDETATIEDRKVARIVLQNIQDNSN
jgi:hypothetical protein